MGLCFSSSYYWLTGKRKTDISCVLGVGVGMNLIFSERNCKLGFTFFKINFYWSIVDLQIGVSLSWVSLLRLSEKVILSAIL